MDRKARHRCFARGDMSLGSAFLSPSTWYVQLTSRDAERAISHLTTAPHNRLSWPMIWMHSIGAEDMVEQGYPYDIVGLPMRAAQEVQLTNCSETM